MNGKPSSRSGILVGLAVAIAVAVGAAGWMHQPAGEEPSGAAPSGSGPSAQVAPSGPEAPPVTHACTADELARVAGLEVGVMVAGEWRTDAITCNDDEACTRIAVSHAAEHLTVRVCAHVEGAPLPPATHGGLDVFYDEPEQPVADTSIHAVVEGVVARMSAS